MKDHVDYLIGIDINKEGIDKIAQKDIIYGNIEELYEVTEIKDINWDIIVAGDVIEHTRNPGKVLVQLYELMSDNTKLIITIPNVFSIKFIYYMLRYGILGKEKYMPGHIFWLSYATFLELIKGTNLEIESSYFLVSARPKGINKIAYALLTKFGIFSPGLFYILKK